MALALFVRSAVLGVPLADTLGQFTIRELLSHVAIIGYASTNTPMLLPPAWSLDLEMQFYLAAPLLCILLKRLGVASFLVLGAILAILPGFVDLGVPVARYLILFMVGMVVSATNWRPSATIQWPSLLVGSLGMGVIVLSGQSEVLFANGSAPATYLLNWGLAAILAPVALATVWRPSTRSDAALGDLSYVVYLAHWPLLGLSAVIAPTAAPPLQLLVFAVLLIAVSIVIWRYIDRPANRMRTKTVGRLSPERIGDVTDAEKSKRVLA